MQKEKKLDIIDMFRMFQQTVLENKPSFSQMYNDVRMMKFKIRPLYGDLSTLNFSNIEFVETLWRLGKLDDFFQNQIKNISEKEKNMFHRLFNEMYQSYYNKLNSIDMKSEDIQKTGFELEIFRDHTEKDMN